MWQLIRYRSNINEKYVEGELHLNNIFICDTLENMDTLIPTGMYTIAVNKSPRFKRDMPLIYSSKVPSSRGIRIHAGNTRTDSKGCILVGLAGKSGTLVTGSREWETLITMMMKKLGEISLVVCDESERFEKD